MWLALRSHSPQRSRPKPGPYTPPFLARPRGCVPPLPPACRPDMAGALAPASPAAPCGTPPRCAPPPPEGHTDPPLTHPVKEPNPVASAPSARTPPPHLRAVAGRALPPAPPAPPPPAAECRTTRGWLPRLQHEQFETPVVDTQLTASRTPPRSSFLPPPPPPSMPAPPVSSTLPSAPSASGGRGGAARTDYDSSWICYCGRRPA